MSSGSNAISVAGFYVSFGDSGFIVLLLIALTIAD
jgi:hypothetical protein